MNTSILPFPQLLTPPIKRAAYSDRTGWLMALLSKLAYIPFENPSRDLKERDLCDLQTQLAQLHFQLIKTFSIHVPWGTDTQAFLAKIDQEGREPFIVLSFRGTEGRKIEDLKTDLNAKAMVLGRLGGPGHNRVIPIGQWNASADEQTWPLVKVHPGFWQAFEAVRPDIETTLSQSALKDLPLYITGHSLGGAIAIVATYVLASDRIAACYTFGAPRVGNMEFGQSIKVPIYRFINANDIVPHLLPGMALDVVARMFGLFRFVPIAGRVIRLLNSYREYRHFGDLRYFSGAVELPREDGRPSYKGLSLYANPPQLQRWCWSLRRLLRRGPTAMFYDHKIDQYINKLACWAYARMEVKGELS
ncbi:lipase family protein [Terasakiella pusilla]|uniref:lipase family protein n=1 Tax=Terasakiella pusilla TaxID=64973 RepID=UPI003AA8F68B